MKKWEMLKGTKFSSLSIVGVKKVGSKYLGVFVCDCGKQTLVDTYKVSNGLVKSCGCNRSKNISIGKTKHGHSKSKNKESSEYSSWRAMKERCNNPLSKSYANYGGKGITICQEWESFITFLNDMGTKPTPNHSIDRVNPYGNYEPANCRWATRALQSINTRDRKGRKNLRGVTKATACNRWMAQITVDYKHHYIGIYKTPEAAHQAYEDAARKLRSISLTPL